MRSIVLWLALTACSTSPSPPASDRTAERPYLISDADFDGHPDGAEIRDGTDPNRADTDGDQVPDGAEVKVFASDPSRDGRFCDPWAVTSFGDYSYAYDLGDIDGDGDLDVVTTRSGYDLVIHEQLGVDSGTFGAAILVLEDLDSSWRPKLGDLDGDGDLDIVVEVRGRGIEFDSLSWLENLGGGAFGAPTLLDARDDIDHLRLVDIDGDGNIDLFYEGESTSGWSLVMLNRGDAVFDAPEFVAFNNPRLLIDLDQDGDLDALGGYEGDWYANDGEGRFADTGQALGTTISNSATLADLDGDGLTDAVWIDNDRAVVWSAKVEGGLMSEVRTILGAGLRFLNVDAADLDNDGDQDLVLYSRKKDALIWLENQGGAVFGAPHIIGAFLTDGSHLAVDIDRDGQVDVLRIESGFSVLHNVLAADLADSDGDGLSDTTERCITQTDPMMADTDGGGVSDADEVWGLPSTDPRDAADDAATGDADGDGLSDTDEVRAGSHPFVEDTDGDGLDDRREVVELGSDPRAVDTDGDGLDDADEVTAGTDLREPDTDGDTLTDGAEQHTHGTDPLVADTDGDGADDGREVDVLGTNPLVADLDGDGDGLIDADELERGSDPALVDTDGDGLPDGDEVSAQTDLLRADTDGDGVGDGAEFLISGTDPTRDESTCAPDWARACVETPGEYTGVAAADLDGDGDLDVVASTREGLLLIENDAGTMRDAGVVSAYVPTHVEVADVDGDGRPDLVFVYNTPTTIGWTRNQGALSFGLVRALPTPASEPTRIRLDDLTGDGLVDLVVDANDSAWWQPNLGGTFGPETQVGVHSELAPLDADGDGDIDLVGADYADSELVVYTNAGDGTLSPGPVLSVPKPRRLRVADVDGDGDGDLVVVNTTDGLAWLESTGGSLSGPRVIQPGRDWLDAAVGDVNADGIPDVVASYGHEDLGTWWYTGQGDGTFGLYDDVTSDRPYSLRAPDLDGDGDADVVHNGGWTHICWHVNRKADDRDGDGLRDETEWCVAGTDPGEPDTDLGGTDDGAELDALTDPLDPADD